MREDYVSVAKVMAETGIPADELIRRIRAGELGGREAPEPMVRQGTLFGL